MTWTDAAPRRRMHPEDRASQLRRVAEVTFAEIGFHAATMDEIAHRAGVSRTVLYRHYDSKDSLAAACLAKTRNHLRELMTAAFPPSRPPDTSDAVAEGARAAFTFIRTHARLYSVFLAEGTLTASAARTEAEGVRRDVEDLAVRLLRAASPEANQARVTLFARAVVGASERIAQGLAMELASERDVDEAVDFLADMIWTGLPVLQTQAGGDLLELRPDLDARDTKRVHSRVRREGEL